MTRDIQFRIALERIAADAGVPLSELPDDGQPNGWRDIAIERINIAREALSATTSTDEMEQLTSRIADDTWRPVASFAGQPTGMGNPLLVAVTGGGKPSVVGEAYFNPTAYDGTWWWASTSYGEYHNSPIEEIMHGTVTHWMTIPAFPAAVEGKG